jgi:hypothetical protein
MCTFSEGDRVRITGSLEWRGGTFSRILPNGKAEVRLRRPKQVRSCASCGAVASLSENASTGEIVCMRSGCGHEHGFDTIVDEFALEQLAMK